jgi:hypothetical protein
MQDSDPGSNTLWSDSITAPSIDAIETSIDDMQTLCAWFENGPQRGAGRMGAGVGVGLVWAGGWAEKKARMCDQKGVTGEELCCLPGKMRGVRAVFFQEVIVGVQVCFVHGKKSLFTSMCGWVQMRCNVDLPLA